MEDRPAAGRSSGRKHRAVERDGQAAELALERSEERFRLLVDAVRDYAIFLLDREGRVASWNPGAERIKGYTADEILGRHFSVFYPRESLDLGWPDEELRRARRDGRFEDENWRVRKDGSLFWANVVIAPLREHDALIGYAKITRDLTERRQLERTLAEAELLSDMDRRKDEFLALLSHELRNPLAPIVNAIHLLRLDADDDSGRAHALEILERQAAHLTRLVEDLIEVSQVSTTPITLHRRRIDAREAVQHGIDSVRPLVERHRLELDVSLPDAPVWILADAPRLEQVVVNLAANATRYNRAGGRVFVELDAAGDQAVIRVHDSGIGIEPELLPRVFDLFATGRRSAARAPQGLGVGLTMVRRIVELHEGRVEACSEGPGCGAQFTVRLPRSAAPESAVSDAAGEGTVPRAAEPRRVLVVDHDADAADSTAMLLERLGHASRAVHSGAEVMGAVLAFRPDVVLIDASLPGGAARGIALRLRDHGAMRIVAIAAAAEPDADPAFDAHLTKPIAPGLLQDALRGSTG